LLFLATLLLGGNPNTPPLIADVDDLSPWFIPLPKFPTLLELIEGIPY
jgi:hypothetical protein